MKKIFYWSPFLTKIATIKSVINSASIIKKKDKHSDIYILNCVGEWNNYEEELKSKNLKIIKLLNFNLHKHLPKTGYFASRVSLIIISFVLPVSFIKSFFFSNVSPELKYSSLFNSIRFFFFK